MTSGLLGFARRAQKPWHGRRYGSRPSRRSGMERLHSIGARNPRCAETDRCAAACDFLTAKPEMLEHSTELHKRLPIGII